MKKTISINLNGILFYIDEDAYERLSAYLNRLKKHFAHYEDSVEIINDIEARIAEILKEKVKNTKEIKNIDDVNEAIAMMGEPSQIDNEDSANSGENSTHEKYEQRRNTNKRLYRDADNRILGGVCAGMAAYLGIDSLWIRILFLFLIFTGFGILIYLILWIVVPLAQTPSERLEMKGERININNIEDSIKEELNQVKNKFSDFKKKEKLNINRGSDLENNLKLILSVISKIFITIVGITLLIIGISLLFSIIIFFTGNMGIFPHHFSNAAVVSLFDVITIFTISQWESYALIISLFMILFIPIFALSWAGIKLIFRIRLHSKVLKVISSSIWILSLLTILFIVIRIWLSFSYFSKHSQKTLLPCKPNQTIVIKAYKEDEKNLNDEITIFDNWFIMDVKGSAQIIGIPKIEIHKTNNDSLSIEVIKLINSRNSTTAQQKADATMYHTLANDSTILLDKNFLISDIKNWGFQKVSVHINVPQHASIQIDHSLQKLID